jgi:hypothetical protein
MMRDALGQTAAKRKGRPKAALRLALAAPQGRNVLKPVKHEEIDTAAR